MAEAGLHPRLAHMVLTAIPQGLGGLACDLAALLSERDIMRGASAASDLRLRIDALHGVTHGCDVDAAALRRVRAEAREIARTFSVTPTSTGTDAAGLLLAFAYPDRIGQQRGQGRFRLRNGRGAAFLRYEPLADAPWLVAADLDDQGAESRIFLAAPVDLADLERAFADQVLPEAVVTWDPKAQAVRARQRTRLGALTLREAPLSDPDPEAALGALLQGITAEGLNILPWSKAARQFQERLTFLHSLADEWPDASDAALTATLADWLGPHLYGLRSRDDLQRLDVTAILTGMLTREQRRELDELAPTHIAVPSGSKVAIDYSDPAAPALAVRLQEVFGLLDTPRIARGRVPLTMHLLSPAHRPVQVTRDLASFWRSAYFEVRKDLRGRYPKHYWPEDPLTAVPTSRTRPRA
jgi:ATP-dependent helicase HrpB